MSGRRPVKNLSGKNHREGVVKFDSLKKAQYLKLLSAGGRRHASARACGVTPQTVVNHANADPEFAVQISMAEMEADDVVEDSLRTAAISGNVTAALAWLYSRRPERWRDMRNVKIELPWRDEARRMIAERKLDYAAFATEFGKNSADEFFGHKTIEVEVSA